MSRNLSKYVMIAVVFVAISALFAVQNALGANNDSSADSSPKGEASCGLALQTQQATDHSGARQSHQQAYYGRLQAGGGFAATPGLEAVNTFASYNNGHFLNAVKATTSDGRTIRLSYDANKTGGNAPGLKAIANLNANEKVSVIVKMSDGKISHYTTTAANSLTAARAPTAIQVNKGAAVSASSPVGNKGNQALRTDPNGITTLSCPGCGSKTYAAPVFGNSNFKNFSVPNTDN